jgi:hypothetical protein
MIDAEVMRLRRLRTTVLQARALAAELDDAHSRRHSVFSRAAVNCWQIARVVTGRLRAHPYLNYQRGPSEFEDLYGGARANWVGMASRSGPRRLRALSVELHRVARELDDARALTWSADLSDTFGRSQTQMRRLIAEVDGSHHGMVPRVEARAAEEAREVAGNWPYLAF